MKKHLVLGALAVLSLAACTKSEVVELNKGNEISLTAVTGKNLTKAADGFCNSAKPTSFDVWAATGGKTYFSKETYTLDGESSTYKSASARYWPNSPATVDFFAAKNYEGDSSPAPTPTFTPSAGATALAIDGYKVTTTVASQKDFIYAVSKDVSKPAGGAAASLNFRHALSQIEFQAMNSNPRIYVEVTGVAVKQVYSKGNFSVNVATTNNFVDHNFGAADTDNRSGRCSWAGQGDKADYAITFDAVALKSVATSLSVKDPDGKEYNANTMYLIPQTVPDRWTVPTPTTPPTPPTPVPTTGKAYFEITAKIWNVAGDAVDKGNDVVLHDGKIAVPIPESTVWADGLRYVYTFNFTSYGTGGVEPGTGEPVLAPIELTVTVDDFVDAGDTDVEVK